MLTRLCQSTEMRRQSGVRHARQVVPGHRHARRVEFGRRGGQRLLLVLLSTAGVVAGSRLSAPGVAARGRAGRRAARRRGRRRRGLGLAQVQRRVRVLGHDDCRRLGRRRRRWP